MTDDLSALDATAHADLISSGALSPSEAVEAAISRVEALNPTLNAVIHTDYERAREAAASTEPGSAPFAGVPFLIKDIGANQSGLPYWAGNQALKAIDYRADADTELGSRFRNAGLVTLGKTNLPELGSSPTTQPISCGPTNNPWDLSRSPSGSSGGSAAAVAAGMVPIAHANDGGGSTRLPAAWCGLVGLKATRGRVPAPDNTSRNLSELVVTRTVRDTARLLDAVQGPTPADLFSIAPPDGPYADELGREVDPLRIALMTTAGPHAVDSDCVEGAEITARVLEEQGHEIEIVSDDVLLGGDSSVNGRLWMAGLARRVEELGELAGRPLTEADVEPYNWTAAQRGKPLLATELAADQQRQQRWSADVVNWLLDYDVLITPTSPTPALPTEDLEAPTVKPWKIAHVFARIGALTIPFNVTGHPAISLPVHQTATGLPVGVQLVAGMGREDLLLRLSALLEQALPWSARRPPVFAGG